MHTSFSNVLMNHIITDCSETVRPRVKCMATITSLREISAVTPTLVTTAMRSPASVHLITATITYSYRRQLLSLTRPQPRPGITHKMLHPTIVRRLPVRASSTATAVGIQELSITYRQIQPVKNHSLHTMEDRAVERLVLHMPLPLKVGFVLEFTSTQMLHADSCYP